MSDREVAQWELEERLRVQRPGLFGGGGRWFRYSKYEVREDESGLVYVAPVKGATLEHYRPFDHYPEILRAFLEMASGFQAAGSGPGAEKEQARHYRAFADEYGLLGLYWHYADGFRLASPDKPEIAVIPNIDNPITTSPVVDHTYYARPFFPNARVPNFAELDRQEDRWLSEYAEPTAFVARAVEHPLFKAQEWNRYRAGGFKPGDEAERGITWADWMSAAEAWPVGVRMAHTKGKWQIQWMSKSLMDALSLMLILNMTTEDAAQQVRLCELEGCGVPYIARHPNQKCCSQRHAATFRKREERRRTKESEGRTNDV